MTQQLVKRQHFVPQTYMKKFSTKSKKEFYIHALNVEKPTATNIFRTNVTKIAVEKDLHTLPGNNDHERMLLEKFYSNEYERHYDIIYKLLIDPQKVTLTVRERELIISTVVTMFYRTTKWINQHNELMERVYNRLFQLAEYTGKDYVMFEQEKISIKDKSLDEVINEHKIENRPSKVLTQLEFALKLIALRIKSDNIYVVTLKQEGCEFITSDNPVVLQNVANKDILPFDPNNIMKLPIDKKTAIFLMPNADKNFQHTIVRYSPDGNRCKLEQLMSNTEQFRNADKFILGELSSLESYLITKEFAENSLSEDELKNFKGFNDIIEKGRKLGLYN